jgi:hypothetical protein
VSGRAPHGGDCNSPPPLFEAAAGEESSLPTYGLRIARIPRAASARPRSRSIPGDRVGTGVVPGRPPGPRPPKGVGVEVGTTSVGVRVAVAVGGGGWVGLTIGVCDGVGVAVDGTDVCVAVGAAVTGVEVNVAVRVGVLVGGRGVDVGVTGVAVGVTGVDVGVFVTVGGMTFTVIVFVPLAVSSGSVVWMVAE